MITIITATTTILITIIFAIIIIMNIIIIIITTIITMLMVILVRQYYRHHTGSGLLCVAWETQIWAQDSPVATPPGVWLVGPARRNSQSILFVSFLQY